VRARRIHPALAIVAVTALAAGLRLWHLGTPAERIFDEKYYSKAGCIFVGYSQDECGIDESDERYWIEKYGDVGSWVHPPLGKWAIGLGERAFGPDAFGWRIAGVVAGSLTVAVVALTAQLLFGSVLWTLAAGLLLAVESLSFVQSRTSMLDVFLALWVALGFLFLVLDRRWIERRTPEPVEEEPPRILSPLVRPWRLAAGVALGAACATKWSGFFALGAAGLLALGWELSRRRRAGVGHPVLRTIARESVGIVIALLVVPALVYVASYTGWFLDFGFSLKKWWALQREIADQHLGGFRPLDAETGKATHPYQSEAWTWFLLLRPVLYHVQDVAGGLRETILAVGNPAVFWASIPAIVYLPTAWGWKRDWRAGALLLPIVLQYVPWFFVGRVQFLFYMTPVVPFIVLAVVYTLRDLSSLRVSGIGSETEERGVRPFLPLAFGVVAAAVVLFAFFWPVLTGGPITTEAWQHRMWLGDRWV